jgi:hypothetical protein
MDASWIKLYRSLKDWQWSKSPKHVALFMHILLRANFKETKWRDATIKPGQLLTGRVQLSEWSGLSEREVRTVLKDLKNSGEIDQQTTRHYSIITITSWADYQMDDQPATIKRPADDQLTTTSKNAKKVKKGISILPETTSESSDSWCQEFVDLFDDQALVAWLKSGNNQKAQARMFETYRPDPIVRFTERAFEWKKSSRKTRQASTFLETWLEKESQKDDSILRTVLTEDERYDLAMKYWGPGIEDQA